MEYKLKSFSELGANELYEILALRNKIFTIEQESIYLDVDNKDKIAYHLFLVDKDEVISYCRLLQKTEDKKASISRVLVKKEHRGNGYGLELMKRAIDFFDEDIEISAQHYLIEFYEHLGFKKTSEVYVDGGVLHVDMELLK